MRTIILICFRVRYLRWFGVTLLLRNVNNEQFVESDSTIKSLREEQLALAQEVRALMDFYVYGQNLHIPQWFQLLPIAKLRYKTNTMREKVENLLNEYSDLERQCRKRMGDIFYNRLKTGTL